MNIRARIKRLLPAYLYNRLMLEFPMLYELSFVNYETNLSREGLDDIRKFISDVAQYPGDIIECGSSRCGTSILITRYLKSLGIDKKIYALDSFQGFPHEEFETEKSLGFTDAPSDAFTSTNFEYIVAKLRNLGCEDDVIPVKGFFEDTLPSIAHGSEYALAFIDCDLQESMTYCADTLWPKLVPGGVTAFDDYNSEEFRGARLAVDASVQCRSREIESHGMLQRLYYVKKRSSK